MLVFSCEGSKVLPYGFPFIFVPISSAVCPSSSERGVASSSKQSLPGDSLKKKKQHINQLTTPSLKYRNLFLVTSVPISRQYVFLIKTEALLPDVKSLGCFNVCEALNLLGDIKTTNAFHHPVKAKKLNFNTYILIGDDCIQFFHLQRCIVRYTVRNFLSHRHVSRAVKHDFRPYILPFTTIYHPK